MVFQADVQSALAAVITVFCYVAAVGQFAVGAMTADMIDTRVDIAHITIIAVYISIATGRNICEYALSSRVGTLFLTYVLRTRISIFAVQVTNTTTWNWSMLTNIINTLINSA